MIGGIGLDVVTLDGIDGGARADGLNAASQ